MKKLSKRVLAVILTIAMLLPMGTFGVVSNAAANIPSDAVAFNGHVYKIYEEWMTWNEANEYCKALQGHLVAITSSEEQSFINSLKTSTTKKYLWIGAFLENGNYKWVTDEDWSYTNWAYGQPDNYRSRYEDTAILYNGNLNYYDKKGDGKWNDLTHDGTNGGNAQYSHDDFGFICEWDIQEQYPDGYNFETDGWSFHNFIRKSTEEQYRNIFMPAKAHLLYLTHGENYGMGGNCYGIALTTIALMNNTPSAESFVGVDGSANTSIADIQRYNSLESTSATEAEDDYIVVRDERTNEEGVHYYRKYAVSEYINYGLLTWLASETVERDKNDCIAVYNAVKEYVQGSRSYPPIIVIAKDRKGADCHAVLGVGIDGNKIIVNDSNHEKTKCYLELKQENGEFTGEWTYLDYHGNKTEDQGLIEWTDGSTYAYPYAALLNDINLDDKDSDYEPIKTEHRMSIQEHLLYTTTDIFYVDSAKIDYTIYNQKKFIPGDESGTEEQNGYLYWVTDTDKKTFTFSEIQEDNSEFMLSDNYSAIYATVSKGSELQLTVDDSAENSSKIITQENAPVTVSFVTTDEEENLITATITGTADGDTVTASETSDGVQVTGLNDITVTLETADGSAETSAKVTDGETVNITVDDPNNTVTTDWQCKHPDDNHDGICDNCGEDFTKDCDCFCHSESKFMQFIFKIVRFLWKLFGIEDRHFCACGKAHW